MPSRPENNFRLWYLSVSFTYKICDFHELFVFIVSIFCSLSSIIKSGWFFTGIWWYNDFKVAACLKFSKFVIHGMSWTLSASKHAAVQHASSCMLHNQGRVHGGGHYGHGHSTFLSAMAMYGFGHSTFCTSDRLQAQSCQWAAFNWQRSTASLKLT